MAIDNTPIQFSDDDRLRFGGDVATTSTSPARHPVTGAILPGTRDSIDGASALYSTFFKGDIIFRAHPEANFHFCPWNKDGTDESRRFYGTLREKGYKPCDAAEWELAPYLREVWEVEEGLIVLRGGVTVLAGGVTPTYQVLMYQTEERWKQENAKTNVIAAQNVAAKAQGDMGAKLNDYGAAGSGLSVLPSKIEEIPHSWRPS